MRMRLGLSRFTLALPIAIFLVVPSSGQAAERRTAPQVRFDVGLASAIGVLGVVYVQPIGSNFEAEAGLGIGATGIQLSLMPKVRFHAGSGWLTSGVGISVAGLGMGVQSRHDADGEAAHDDEPLLWMNMDLLGYEYLSEGGYVFAVSGGITMPLRTFHWDAAEMGDNVKAYTIIPQGRAGFGWWF